MIGRADIEGSKSNVAMDAWLPQASYPCGNFSDTSCLKLSKTKGSIGPAFAVCIRTENQNQASFCPFALREVSVLSELALGHLRYRLTDVPPQSNSPPDTVFGADHVRSKTKRLTLKARADAQIPLNRIRKETIKVVVFHDRHEASHLFYTFYVSSQSRTRVKLNSLNLKLLTSPE
jgi:hypothetical protein